MIKAVLFDIDGVIIRHKDYFWNSLSSDKYNDPSSALAQLYKSDDNRRCDKGEMSILDYIQPFLKCIKRDKSTEEYLNQQYSYESQFIDSALLERIESIKKCGIVTIIASNQNQFRKNFLISSLNSKNGFSDHYFSSDLGYVKSENEYWEIVLNSIREKYGILYAEELIFIDDNEKNTMKAREYGLLTSTVSNEDDIENIMVEIEKESGVDSTYKCKS